MGGKGGKGGEGGEGRVGMRSQVWEDGVRDDSERGCHVGMEGEECWECGMGWWQGRRVGGGEGRLEGLHGDVEVAAGTGGLGTAFGRAPYDGQGQG